jgi:hypothetical protein
MLTTALKKPVKVGIVALMMLGGLMLWVGNPVIWLWVGSQVTSSQQAGFGPYMLVAAGIIASTVVTALLLARLNRFYERVAGISTVRVRLPWLRSLRDERQQTKTVTVFDAIMVGTAITAVTVLGVWFLFFAGSSLPS